MGVLNRLLSKDETYVALLLYGMVLSTCFNGYDAGIMTVILADSQFREYYQMTADKTGLIASIPWVATGLAQLGIGGTLASTVGRLWALRISIGSMCVGVMIQVVPNTFAVLVVGRLITGLGFGCVYIATNLYVAECAPTRLRGSFVGTVSQAGYQLGSLLAFWAGYGMSAYRVPSNIAWRVSNLLQVPIGVIFICLSLFYPESPRWLLEKYPENPDRSFQVLAKIRSGNVEDERIRGEFHELVASHEFRKQYATGYACLFKTAAMRKRLAYGFYVMALQQFGGIAALTIYATLIYQSLGWDQGRQALAINGIQSVLQLLVVFVNTLTVDKFGRRALLICGFTIQSGALAVLSALTTSFPSNSNRAAAVVEIAMFFIIGLTYCWSNGPVTPAIASEIFPQHVRDKAFGLSLLGQTACLLALVQSWPTFNQRVGPKSYWLLLGLNILALLSVIAILPETKGISLERMDKIFGQVDAVDAVEQRHQTDHVEARAGVNKNTALG